jgi:hypothetical protein
MHRASSVSQPVAANARKAGPADTRHDVGGSKPHEQPAQPNSAACLRLASFANTEGGILVVGVREGGEVVGTDVARLTRAVEQVRQALCRAMNACSDCTKQTSAMMYARGKSMRVTPGPVPPGASAAIRSPAGAVP